MAKAKKTSGKRTRAAAKAGGAAGRRGAKRGAAKVKGAAEANERKNRVLQARVPESLYSDLVDQAGRLRVPVSNLVRNILEDSIRMVETIVDGGIEIAEALGGRASQKELSSVAGWQPMTANRRLACAGCGAAIAKGQEAFTSVGASGGRTFVICGECQCAL